jgi:myosin-5
MKQNQESANLIPTNQSILVSGESGAGKTVTTKIVLNYFAMLSKQVRLFIDTESALLSMH